jgi:2'-5' RNA ligase
MSSNLVIVAIPDENDRSWKVSSEKVPHLTVLFLGDVDQISNLETIVQFVEHAANTTLGRFHLPVDRRGELGEDQADVLFFKKGRHDYKVIRDFRASLLQDTNIKTAHDSATQFDGPWNPHLTLGYPTAQAKPDPDDSTFYEVSFNKIAVWTGDFEGPEFLLKDLWDEFDALEAVPMDVAMSNINQVRVKAGMLALSHAVKVSDTPWSQFKTSDYTDEQYARACLLDRGENAGTAKQRYGLPVREPSGTVNRNACHAAAAVLSSVGGTGSARGSKVKGSPEQIASAKKKLISLYKNTLDEDVPKGLGGEESMKQTEDFGAEFVLEHFGVKGMKWGVRKENVAGAAKSVGKAAASAGRFAGDVAFEANLGKGHGQNTVQMQVCSKAAKAFKRTDLPAIKSKPEYQKAKKLPNRLRHPRDPVTKAYRKEVKEAYIQRLEDAANSMTNLSGTRQYTIRERGWELPAEGGALPRSKHFWAVTSREIKHADGEITTTVEVMLDDDGFITDLNPIENSMAQTVDLGAEFLKHHGVKGMKWGVRKVEGGGERAHIRIKEKTGKATLSKQSTAAILAPALIFPPLAPAAFLSPRVRAEVKAARAVNKGVRADKKLSKEEEKFTKHAQQASNFVAIHNGALNRINREIGEHNQKYPDLSQPSTRKAYDDAVLKSMQDSYRESANSLVNKKNTMHLDIEFRNDGQDFVIKAKKGPGKPQVHHAAGDQNEEVTLEITGKIKRDATGHIIGFVFNSLDQGSMAQSAADLGAEFLEHYGIKGMHWGVRRHREVSATGHVDTGLLKRRTKVLTKGGEAHPAHDDAVVAAIQKQKVKKSGTDALSTQELRELANRLQVESQVSILMSSKGKRFVQGQLEAEGKKAIKKGARKAAPHVIKRAGKSAATVATTAALL